MKCIQTHGTELGALAVSGSGSLVRTRVVTSLESTARERGVVSTLVPVCISAWTVRTTVCSCNDNNYCIVYTHVPTYRHMHARTHAHTHNRTCAHANKWIYEEKLIS